VGETCPPRLYGRIDLCGKPTCFGRKRRIREHADNLPTLFILQSQPIVAVVLAATSISVPFTDQMVSLSSQYDVCDSSPEPFPSRQIGRPLELQQLRDCRRDRFDAHLLRIRVHRPTHLPPADFGKGFLVAVPGSCFSGLRTMVVQHIACVRLVPVLAQKAGQTDPQSPRRMSNPKNKIRALQPKNPCRIRRGR